MVLWAIKPQKIPFQTGFHNFGHYCTPSRKELHCIELNFWIKSQKTNNTYQKLKPVTIKWRLIRAFDVIKCRNGVQFLKNKKHGLFKKMKMLNKKLKKIVIFNKFFFPNVSLISSIEHFFEEFVHE